MEFFDANGNRRSHTWGGMTDIYLPQATSNCIPTITGTRAKTFGFDTGVLGNIDSGTSATAGNQSYGCDAFNRPSSITAASGTTNYAINAAEPAGEEDCFTMYWV